MTSPFNSTPDSATIGTAEHFLFSDSTTATYQTVATKVRAVIDWSAMTATEQYQRTVYEKVNGSSARIVDQVVHTGVQAFPHESIPEEWLSEGYEIGIKKLAGTDRSIGWSTKRDLGILDAVYEGSETLRAYLRLTRSMLVGKGSGLLTNPVMRDAADSKDRLTWTVGGSGDTRSVVTDAT